MQMDSMKCNCSASRFVLSLLAFAIVSLCVKTANAQDGLWKFAGPADPDLVQSSRRGGAELKDSAPFDELIEDLRQAWNNPTNKLAVAQRWMKRFDEMIARNPPVMNRMAIIRSAVTAANELEQWDDGIRLAKIGAAEARDAVDAMHWQLQILAITKAQQYFAGTIDDPKSIAELLETIRVMEPGIKVVSRDPIAVRGRVSSSSVTWVLGLKARALSKLGDHIGAATVYDRIASFIEQWAAMGERSVGMSGVADMWLDYAARERLALGQIDEALEAVQKIATLSLSSSSPSFHAQGILSSVSDAEVVWQFAVRWLENPGWDIHTVFILNQLAGISNRSFQQNPERLAVLRDMIETLMVDGKELLEAADNDILKESDAKSLEQYPEFSHSQSISLGRELMRIYQVIGPSPNAEFIARWYLTKEVRPEIVEARYARRLLQGEVEIPPHP